MTDNELIAEFMGWERYSGNSFKCPNIYPIGNSTSDGWTTFTSEQLDFHNRWDWIIPVCAKSKDVYYMMPNGQRLYRDIELALLTLNIKKVNVSCLKFITAFNELKTLWKPL